MEKRKMGLQSLLAKYDGSHQSSYASPVRDRNQNYIEEEFYQYPQKSRTFQQDTYPLVQKVALVQTSQTRTVSGNFNMSKSECEAFLISIRDQISREQKILNQHIEAALRTLHQNFQREHERLRRELLDMMDKAFAENERAIRQELANISKTDSPQFQGIFQKITTMDQDIEKLINGLRSPDYRRTIAAVVTRDFQIDINELHGLIANAKDSYFKHLGDVQIDRTKVNLVQENIRNLFYLNRRVVNSSPPKTQNHIYEVGKGIFSVVGQRSSQPAVAQSRTRKSFFNFGGD